MAGEIIQHQTEDGVTVIRLQACDGKVWLSQAEIAELLRATPQAITQHIHAIYEDGELEEAATCNDYLQVRTEGTREVSRRNAHYYRAINAPSAVEQHFLEAVGKAMAIEGGRPATAMKGKA